MVSTCGAGAMLYVLPMLLGRTYDMRTDKVGIDIFRQEDIDEAEKNPVINPEVHSSYMTIEESQEKRDFLGISGELGIKVSSGLLDIRGAGEYLRDTSNAENSVEILIKITFITQSLQLNLDAKPMEYWKLMDPKKVGTHVVSKLIYGGQMFASVNYVASKHQYLEDIKGEVEAAISKSGAFDINAQADLQKLTQNISSKAKMEMDYFANVPLSGVPTTISGLGELVEKFKELVEQVNNGKGVIICAELRPLEEFDDKFTFLKNNMLLNALEEFNYLFDNLREAKSLLRSLVNSLPETVSEAFLRKIMDFSERLSNVLDKFYEVIGNLNLEEGSEQLAPAEEAFDLNSDIEGDNRYTKEVKQLINENTIPTSLRGIYTHWGKRACGHKASDVLYIGYMASFVEEGIGAGTNYQCLPENPNLKLDPDATGLDKRTTKLGGIRYKNMTVFKGNGKRIEGKVAACTVCETPLRPVVKMFPGATVCPNDWVQEYTGYIVGNYHGMMRSEFACVNFDPDTYDFKTKAKGDPAILPVKMGTNDGGNKYRAEAALPCVVCSK
ncbi:hypothetical protein CDAR_419751 [Caerostris darwini]|uniref:Uncharacterized protein n=1 Tax=Caerostris darwini TaxID=1538125 RepID=A0AAV4MRG7_9ARAC|nr:hypothetical protein CDAR_419751 [Caerostris darwini]